MARLTTKARKAIPKREFAGPGRSYPIEDLAHAIDAKGRAKQELNRGILSRAEYGSIVAKANRKLGR